MAVEATLRGDALVDALDLPQGGAAGGGVGAGAWPSWQPVLRGAGRRARVRRWLLATGGLLLVAVIAAAGALAWELYDYRRSLAGRILPGATIAGEDVGGLAAPQALARVEAVVAPQLDRTITLTFQDQSWTRSPRQLGATSDTQAVVAAAVEASRQPSWSLLAQSRFFDGVFAYSANVTITQPEEHPYRWLEEIAATIDRPARDASMDWSSGWVEVVEEQIGLETLVEETHAGLMDLLQHGGDRLALGVVGSEPAVRRDALGQILLVRQQDNTTHLYDDGVLTHSWTVSTGTSGYPTPTGEFTVGLKRYLPTWGNPSPDGWGADLPLAIGPGPGNPLGLRALNWHDAEGRDTAIRFHGTNAVRTLGQAASHGCVRMRNDDVVELYDLVEEGARIISVDGSTEAPPF